MRLWFTSDTHFGHARVIEYCNRPYESVEEMNLAMLESLRVVKPGDTLVHLGDVMLCKRPEMRAFVALWNTALDGVRKVLVKGNHDRDPALLKHAFDEMHDDMIVEHAGVRFWCNHIPISNGHDHRDLRRPDRHLGTYDIALCGHVHDRWKLGPSGELNVGMDAWHMRPVSAEALIAVDAARKR